MQLARNDQKGSHSGLCAAHRSRIRFAGTAWPYASEGVAVRVHFCGVRGSTPVADAAFLRYGGSTSCVAVSHDDGQPRLLLHAGPRPIAPAALLRPPPI